MTNRGGIAITILSMKYSANKSTPFKNGTIKPPEEYAINFLYDD